MDLKEWEGEKLNSLLNIKLIISVCWLCAGDANPMAAVGAAARVTVMARTKPEKKPLILNRERYIIAFYREFMQKEDKPRKKKKKSMRKKNK